MRILVVDDDANTRVLLSGALRKWGYQVVAVADGEEAWLELERDPNQLVLCDWEMPNLEGPDLCLRVRARIPSPYVYFVLLTHHSDSQSVARGLDSGADDFVSKPFNPVELRARLEVGKRMLRLHESLLAKTQELDRLNEKLRHLAATDSLTQLGNRRGLEETMGPLHALATERGQTYGVLLLDIDHFKSINDRFGHPTGDRVLSATAEALRSVTRGSDLVFRYGGEEYVVVASGTNTAALRGLAERLRIAVANQAIDTRTPAGIVHISVSLGGALFDGREAVDWRTLVARADAALYAAKNAGRNCFVVTGECET